MKRYVLLVGGTGARLADEAIDSEDQSLTGGRRKDVPGSAAFVPSAMGLLIASYVVRKLSFAQ